MTVPMVLGVKNAYRHFEASLLDNMTMNTQAKTNTNERDPS
jgi:hypothetical protein